MLNHGTSYNQPVSRVLFPIARDSIIYLVPASLPESINLPASIERAAH